MTEEGEGSGRPRLPQVSRSRLAARPALFARRGNRVEGSGIGAALLRLATVFDANAANNVVTVGKNFRTHGLFIAINGRDNRVVIGDDVKLSGKIGLRGVGVSVRIGARCDIKRTRVVACDADLVIGCDCLVAAGVRFRTSDMHVIADRDTGAPINAAEAVVVGDSVWIAGEAALLKGARVAEGCVVGFRSVVTKAFDEPDCIIVGAPAEIVRRRIVWSR